MHGSWVGWDKVDRVMLIPRDHRTHRVRYIVRTAPGELDRVMTAAESALRKRDPNRVVGKLKKMSDDKQRSYSGDMLMAVTLTVVTGLVLVFSSLGIFGLATFNVNTRTRQIGTRRAVGARKLDIVRYFMAENWLVTTLGVVVGLLPRAGRRDSGCRPSTSCRVSTSTTSSAACSACGSWASWPPGSPRCAPRRCRRPWPRGIYDVTSLATASRPQASYA